MLECPFSRRVIFWILYYIFTYRKARKQGFSSYGSHANSISPTRCICFLGLLNTLPECLIQWQSFSHSAGGQKATMKLPAGPHVLGRLRKDLFLPLPHSWCSQQCLVALSLQTHHSECCLGHQHSVLLCLSGSVSCIYFSYKDSNLIEFRPQPKPAQSHPHWAIYKIVTSSPATLYLQPYHTEHVLFYLLFT